MAVTLEAVQEEIDAETGDRVFVVARPEFIKQETVCAFLPANTNLGEFLRDAGDDISVQISGRIIPRDQWNSTFLQPGTIVNILRVPGNDQTLTSLALVAMVAVATWGGGLAAAGLFGQLSTLGTWGKLGYGLTVAAFTFAGATIAQKLVPTPRTPVPDSTSVTRLQSITGANNAINPYGVVPKVLGDAKYFPPLAAKPYTELLDNDQYLHMLLCLGYGELYIGGDPTGGGVVTALGSVIDQNSGLPYGTITISNTDISAYSGVLFEIGRMQDITQFINDVSETQLSDVMNEPQDVTVHDYIANSVAARAVDQSGNGNNLVAPQHIFGSTDLVIGLGDIPIPSGTTYAQITNYTDPLNWDASNPVMLPGYEDAFMLQYGSFQPLKITALSIANESLTVEFWIYACSSFGSPLDGTTQYILCNGVYATSGSFAVYLQSNAINFAWYAGAAYNSIADPVALTYNTWHHFALVFNNSTGRAEIFRDGVSVNFTVQLVPLAQLTSSPDIYFGATPSNTNQCKAGIAILDLRIWGAARTSTQITGNKNGPIDGLSLVSEGLLAYFPGERPRFDTSTTRIPIITKDFVTVTRTTPAQHATKISVDITLDSLWTYNWDSQTSGAWVEFAVRYKQTTNTAWLIPTGNGFDANGVIRINGPIKQTVRKTFIIDVADVADTFDIKITRLRSYTESGAVIYNNATLTAIRASGNSVPFDVTNTDIILMALSIKATDQLNGVIDKLQVRAASQVRVYTDLVTYTNTYTNNPAWLALEALIGTQVANPIGVTNVDLQAFLDCAATNTTYGFAYNWVHDADETIQQRVLAILDPAHATIGNIDGKWTIIQDSPQTTGVQVISPRNSLLKSYNSQKTFQDLPHAIRVRFTDPTTWQADDEVIAYRTGYSSDGAGGTTIATRFEELQPQGITNSVQAHKYGQYYIKNAIERPEIHTAQMSAENLVATRGDMVYLAYDVIKVGLKWGRITNIAGAVITLDEEVTIEAGNTYALRIRHQDNTYSVTTITTSPSVTQVVTLSTADATANVGDLVLFGIYNLESLEAKVTEIRYGNDLSATLTLVDNASDLFNFDTPPTFQSHITEPADLTKIPPGVPSIIGFVSDESVLYRDAGGTLKASLVVTFALSTTNLVPVGLIQLRYQVQGADAAWIYEDATVGNTNFRVTNVEQGQIITFQLRCRSIFNVWSEWTTAQSTTIVGKATPPNDVTGFAGIVDTDNVLIKLSWNANTDVDLKTYRVKSTPVATGAPWATADFVGDFKTTAISLPVPTVPTIYMIKAVDSAVPENESTNDVSVTISVSAPSVPQAFTYVISGPDVILTWGAPASNDFAIVDYEVTKGGVAYTTLKSKQLQLRVDWSGSETFTVAARDANNQLGPTASQSVTVAPPSTPTWASGSPKVVDNNVLLRWSATQGTLPIQEYAILKDGVEIQRISGTFATFFEDTAGNYTYAIIAYDTTLLDANKSGTLSQTVTVNEPSGYVLVLDHISTFDTTPTETYSATLTNCVKDLTNNKLVIPVQSTETYQDHFVNNAFTSPQDQITAGDTYWLEPSTTGASYVEELDLGTTIDSSTIKLLIASTVIDGSVTLTSMISTAPDSGGVPGTYTDFAAGTTTVFAQSFRFVKVTVTATATAGANLAAINSLEVKLDRKKITDSGTVTDSTLGHSLAFNGTNQYGAISASASLNVTGPFTLLVDFEAASGTGPILEYNNNTNSGVQLWQYSAAGDLYVDMVDTGGTSHILQVNNVLTAGDRYRALVRYTGTALELWLDGRLIGSLTVTATPQTSYAIGLSRRLSTTEYRAGSLNEVRLYGRSVSDAEAAEISYGSYVNNTNLELAIDFHEGTGTTASDSSGNGNNCTLTGSPTWGDDYGLLVPFNEAFVDITSLTTSAQYPAFTAIHDFHDVANPILFRTLIYDKSGNRITGTVRWAADGY